jgi:hypothetical protein
VTGRPAHAALLALAALGVAACNTPRRPPQVEALYRYYESAEYRARVAEETAIIRRVRQDADALRARGQTQAAADATAEAIAASIALHELGAPMPDTSFRRVVDRAHLLIEAGQCVWGHELLVELGMLRTLSPPVRQVLTPPVVWSLHEAAVQCALWPPFILPSPVEDVRQPLADWRLLTERDPGLGGTGLDAARLAYLHAEVAFSTGEGDGDSLFAFAESQSMRLLKRDYPAWQRWSGRARRERHGRALVAAVRDAPDTAAVASLLARATGRDSATLAFARFDGALALARRLAAANDTTGAAESLLAELAERGWFNAGLAERLRRSLAAERWVPAPGNPWVELDVLRAEVRRWWRQRVLEAEGRAAPSGTPR